MTANLLNAVSLENERFRLAMDLLEERAMHDRPLLDEFMVSCAKERATHFANLKRIVQLGVEA